MAKPNLYWMNSNPAQRAIRYRGNGNPATVPRFPMFHFRSIQERCLIRLNPFGPIATPLMPKGVQIAMTLLSSAMVSGWVAVRPMGRLGGAGSIPSSSQGASGMASTASGSITKKPSTILSALQSWAGTIRFGTGGKSFAAITERPIDFNSNRIEWISFNEIGLKLSYLIFSKSNSAERSVFKKGDKKACRHVKKGTKKHVAKRGQNGGHADMPKMSKCPLYVGMSLQIVPFMSAYTIVTLYVPLAPW